MSEGPGAAQFLFLSDHLPTIVLCYYNSARFHFIYFENILDLNQNLEHRNLPMCHILRILSNRTESSVYRKYSETSTEPD